MLTLNRFHTVLLLFHCWLWTSQYRLWEIPEIKICLESLSFITVLKKKGIKKGGIRCYKVRQDFIRKWNRNYKAKRLLQSAIQGILWKLFCCLICLWNWKKKKKKKSMSCNKIITKYLCCNSYSPRFGSSNDSLWCQISSAFFKLIYWWLVR